MGKDKKSKADKKAKAAEKRVKQEKKAEKRAKSKAAKIEESDAEDVDLDKILDEYKRQQEAFLKITDVVVDAPPRTRTAGCFLANPSNKNELLLFGGEYFNGSIATFFGDLNIYSISRDEWRSVTSPNAPLPRSGHAWCRGGNQSNAVFLFGGEFSSPKQGTFYHYNDFWRLEPSTKEWTRLEPKGKTPPARSGHRMIYFKQYIILFGGFQDTSNQTKYLADLWIYDTEKFAWHSPSLPAAQLKPDARSSFTFLPHEQGAVLYGGYSRVKATTTAGKGGKRPASGQRNILKPLVHQDCFYLRITPPNPGSPAKSLPAVRWERRKRPANAPNPARAGCTMAFHKGRGILFGGVHDVEQSEDGIDSEFFNQLFAYNIERNRFFSLPLRKPRMQRKTLAAEQRGGRRNRGAKKEKELLKQLAALETGKSLEDVDDMEIDQEVESEEDVQPAREMTVSMEMPHPRFNSLLAVQGDTLYIYGGTFEKADREFTFDDLYAIDLGNMDGCKEVFYRQLDDWMVSEDEEDEEEEDEDDEDEEVGDEGDWEDVRMEDADDPKQKRSKTSKRKNKQVDEALEADTTMTEVTEKEKEEEEEEEEEEEVNTTVDDGLPHPRPFESRRDFFARTCNGWREILMESLKRKGTAMEKLSVKEFKTKAFELSEEKWWDCREEISALEEEQEAAGINEIVSLTERGDNTGGAGAAGRRR